MAWLSLLTAAVGLGFVLAGDAPSDRTPPHCLRTRPRSGEGSRPGRAIAAHEDYFGGEGGRG